MLPRASEIQVTALPPLTWPDKLLPMAGTHVNLFLAAVAIYITYEPSGSARPPEPAPLRVCYQDRALQTPQTGCGMPHAPAPLPLRHLALSTRMLSTQPGEEHGPLSGRRPEQPPTL